MGESNASIGFVIKATSASGLAMWVSAPRFGDHRTFGPREKSDVSRLRGEAHATIGKLPPSFERRIRVFGRIRGLKRPIAIRREGDRTRLLHQLDPSVLKSAKSVSMATGLTKW